MKVIYIAGKYRGPNAWTIEQNIRAAEEVAARVWALGMVAMCPHANSRHMEGVASDEHFLAGTLELLRRCDAVVLVPNWRDSAGARAEKAEAERLGIPVFHEVEHIAEAAGLLERLPAEPSETLRTALEHCLVASDEINGRESIHDACRQVGLQVDWAGDGKPTWGEVLR